MYFFSGTGNSLVVARDLAAALEGRAIPIAVHVDRGPIHTEAGVLGIVFPVYYAGLPAIVRRFAESLEARQEAYLFAVTTYGGGMGDSVRELRAALQSGPASLSAALGVHMPQNAFRKPWENHSQIHAAWHERKLPRIAGSILSRRRGMSPKNAISNAILSPLNGWLKSKTRVHLAGLSGISVDAPMEQLFAHADASFATNAACTECGVCSRVCPVGNIEMSENGPRWLHRCEGCHACYHWCPRRAIESKIAQEGYFYHSPDVSLEDMEAGTA